MDDDRIAEDDDRERDDESQEKAGDGHDLVAKKSQLIHRWSFVVVGESKVVEAVDDVLVEEGRPRVPEDEVRGAENQSQHPHADAHTGRLTNVSVVLGPDGPHHGHTSVHTDHYQNVNTGKHVQKAYGGVELAHELPKAPVEFHGGVGHTERQECREEEVRHCEVEEPNCVDCFFHLEARYPDDHPVPKHTEKESKAVNDDRHDV